jgi:hypothetical protein
MAGLFDSIVAFSALATDFFNSIDPERPPNTCAVENPQSYSLRIGTITQRAAFSPGRRSALGWVDALTRGAGDGVRGSAQAPVAGVSHGGRDRDRTCDPYHVKVVLFR